MKYVFVIEGYYLRMFSITINDMKYEKIYIKTNRKVCTYVIYMTFTSVNYVIFANNRSFVWK